MECFPTQMSIIPLFALPSGIEMTTCSKLEEVLCVSLLSTQLSSPCPLCGTAATRIHSHYQRRLADLPSAGQPVRWYCQLSVMMILFSSRSGKEILLFGQFYSVF